MNPKLNSVVKAFIIIGMLLGVVILVFAVRYMILFPTFSFQEGELARCYVSGGLGVLCLFGCEFIACTLFMMMRSLSGDPFIIENVRALRRMGFTALGVTVCGLMTMAFWPVPLAVVGALPVGMCGLFSLVLSGVFERAVAFKQENDLTV